jgi:hypothetical protein
MKHPNPKTMDDVIAPNAADGMRRLRDGLRQVLSAPKPAPTLHRKSQRRKK